MPSRPPASLRARIAARIEKALAHLEAPRRRGLLRGSSGTTILVYHSVPGPQARPWVDPRYATAPEVFARQMRFLATHRRVVPLGDLVAAVERGRTLEPGAVVVTFDDGYLDNHTVAAPILRAHGLPATFFLATGYVDRGTPQWIDELYSLYRARTAATLRFPGAGPSYDLGDQREVDASYALLGSMLLAADFDGRSRLLADLRRQLRPAALPPRLTMGWREVRELLAADAGFEIGVHTRDHIALPGMRPERIAEELARCVADVRTRVGLQPRFFSFPYGRWCGASRRLVAARFQAAVVTDPPAPIDARSDLFALPRVALPDDAARWQFWTSGAQAGLARYLLPGA